MGTKTVIPEAKFIALRHALGIEPAPCSYCKHSRKSVDQELDCLSAEACYPDRLTQRFARFNRYRRACGPEGKYWEPK